ncbi:hypothetical protein TWF718_003532 [Orbilia javanica]|uniref:Uncharacterized protein n=1 Tax=Orbilia javanica TaxID=47235 RepID=A0AAN8R943_9PEZI
MDPRRQDFGRHRYAVNPEEEDLASLEVIMTEQLEASLTVHETSWNPERPGSPVKRKFNFSSQGESSLASYRDLTTRRLAEPVSRLVSTKLPRSTNSSPEKQSTRSQSRTSSPDKQSISAKTTVSQASASVPMRRAAMAKSLPAFVFSQAHRFASGSIPQAVFNIKKQILPEGLGTGVLPSSAREHLVAQFTDNEFPPSLFSDSPEYGNDFVDHVVSYLKTGLRRYRDDVAESVWSDMAKNLLGGLSREMEGHLEVTGVENNSLHPGILPMKTPSLRSDVVIQINQLYDTKFGQMCRRARSPPVEIDATFSPFAHPSLKETPAFAVVEIKVGGGDL